HGREDIEHADHDGGPAQAHPPPRRISRVGSQRDELAPLHVGHWDSLPRWRRRSLYRTLNLPPKGGQVLGVNCSQSRSALQPSCAATQTIAHRWCTRRPLRKPTTYCLVDGGPAERVAHAGRAFSPLRATTLRAPRPLSFYHGVGTRGGSATGQIRSFGIIGSMSALALFADSSRKAPEGK